MKQLNILELEKSLETTDDKILIIRDELSDTKKMTRKIYFELLPNIELKLNRIDDKINNLISKFEKLDHKIDEVNELLIKLLNKNI